MKLIIDIPEDVVTAIQNGQDYRYDIHTAIAQGKPCDTSGDLISRNALKEALSKRLWFVSSPECDAQEIKEVIDNAPTVEERYCSEWMVTAEDNDGIHRIECPFCRYEKGSDFIDYITVTFEKLPPFCENCGADMKGANGKVDS